MPTKRTLRRQLADAHAQIRRLVDDRDEAREELASRKWIANNLTSSRDDLAITRTRERDAALRTLRTTEDQLAAARAELAARPAGAAELRDARRRLLLAETARASLAQQLADVQKSNDAMSRERVTAAGTLARREVAS